MLNEPKILMVASEATPFAKTGGLADVIGALSPTLRRHGEDVAVLLPRYRGISLEGLPLIYKGLQVWLGSQCYSANVYRAEERGVPYFLVDCPPLYDREQFYGDPSGDYPDNHIRFAMFCQVALRMVRDVFRPAVLHCHDWQAALVSTYIKMLYATDPTYMGIRTVLTIHNLGYQGLFPAEALPDVGLPPGALAPEGPLEFFGKLNLLKGGIVYSDAVTTVSPTYAREIQTPELGFGLDGVLRSRADAVYGILNGVDYTVWDPETDPNIAARYSIADLGGKRVCKADLLASFGLPENPLRPVIGIVGRLVSQKGLDLIEQIAPELMAEDVALVVLGTGDPKYQAVLEALQAANPEKVGVRIAYDNVLAHKIEAGADMFLMPSLYEPCGLNQIYSLRYGTVPVVRATGGLDDTITPATGFKFREYTGAALLEAIRAALAAFRNQSNWRAMMLAGMRQDFSWNASAAEYARLYHRLTD